MTPSRIVYLVSCVAKKRKQRSPARDLYTSPWFQKARRYVEERCGQWFILSAKHGLVAPDEQIDDYNTTLNKMRVADRHTWAERVLCELRQRVPGLTQVVFLAGERYREFLVKPLQEDGVEVCVPMEGLKIGQQLQWFTRQAHE